VSANWNARPVAINRSRLRLSVTEHREEVIMRVLHHREIVAVVAVIAALCIAIPAQAQDPQFVPQARIVVTGQGSVTAPPDYAEIRTGVTTRGKSAKDALDANSKLMTTVTAVLQNSGVDQKDIQTSRFSIEPVYAQQQANSVRSLAGFEASNRVGVTVRQIAKLGEILDKLVSAGATDIGGIEFMHADPVKALDQARQAAVADARRKAALYAQASGLTLGGVFWITEDQAYAPVMKAGMMRAAAGGMPAPIAAGEDTLQATVSVGFDVAR
jgi:uncharacterized protein YggE